MDKDKSIKLFEETQIRTHWDEEREEWFFSVVDVCGALSESRSIDPSAYWRKLKQRMKAEGNETVTNCHGLKMKAADGKMRMTDVLNTKGILRLIQSIPSKKAEPFKMWLAKVGSDRLDEIADPELAIDRALETYLRKGYSEKWINQRLKSIEVRKELTDEWESRGVQKGEEFALLTNEITKAWSGKTTSEYKQYKGLKKESLRDNMTNTELVLNMLAEVATTDISKEVNPETFVENRNVARQGGNVAKVAREQLEQSTGKKVVTSKNAKNLKELKGSEESET